MWWKKHLIWILDSWWLILVSFTSMVLGKQFIPKNPFYFSGPGFLSSVILFLIEAYKCDIMEGISKLTYFRIALHFSHILFSPLKSNTISLVWSLMMMHAMVSTTNAPVQQRLQQPLPFSLISLWRDLSSRDPGSSGMFLKSSSYDFRVLK